MSARPQPIRVFQVATGNVGREMIKRLQTRPDLELIGLHCYSPDKVGADAGELAGIGPIGVTATGSVSDIVAAKPDVLTFHGVFPTKTSMSKCSRRASISSPPPTGSPGGTAITTIHIHRASR
ncbi:hypothetical protein MMRN_19830 [Mycobacterium marinum]|nr:hypothetical protein MMRN_19830 [Mycobacterium marinum]